MEKIDYMKVIHPDYIEPKPKKTTKPTSLVSTKSKNSLTKDPVQKYKEMQFICQSPQPEFIDRLAKELIEWARYDENALRIEDFHWDRDITDGYFYKWVNEFETLNFAHKIAKNSIASRREKGMLSRDMPDSAILKSLYLWDLKHEIVRQDEIAARKEIAIEVAKAKVLAEREDRPTTVILGELPGLAEYAKKIEEKKAEDVESK